MVATTIFFDIEATECKYSLPYTTNLAIGWRNDSQPIRIRHETVGHHIQQFLRFHKAMKQPNRNALVHGPEKIRKKFIDLFALESGEFQFFGDSFLFGSFSFIELVSKLECCKALLELYHSAAKLIVLSTVLNLESPFTEPRYQVKADISKHCPEMFQAGFCAAIFFLAHQ